MLPTAYIYGVNNFTCSVPLLKTQFLHTHCDDDSLEAAAKGSVNRFFTPEDAEKVYKCVTDPGQVDPYQSDDLRQHLSLEVDRFGVVDSVCCWKAVHGTITSDIEVWRVAHPGLVSWNVHKRTTSEQVEPIRITAQRKAASRLQCYS